MKTSSILVLALSLCFAIASMGCSSSANTAANTSANSNKSNTAVVVNTSTTNTATNTAANTQIAKSEPAGDSVGVPECDEYIKKYEACLTTIAAKAPQAQPGLKASFEAQRNGFKAAAATPQGKTALASSCKQAIETAKTSTAQWCTNW
jgi:hypothetical protein